MLRAGVEPVDLDIGGVGDQRDLADLPCLGQLGPPFDRGLPGLFARVGQEEAGCGTCSAPSPAPVPRCAAPPTLCAPAGSFVRRTSPQQQQAEEYVSHVYESKYGEAEPIKLLEKGYELSDAERMLCGHRANALTALARTLPATSRPTLRGSAGGGARLWSRGPDTMVWREKAFAAASRGKPEVGDEG